MKKLYLFALILLCGFLSFSQEPLIIRKNGKIVIGSTLGTYNYLGDISSFRDISVRTYVAGTVAGVVTRFAIGMFVVLDLLLW